MARAHRATRLNRQGGAELLVPSTRAERIRRKNALVEALMRQAGEFHVVAELPLAASRSALEDAVRGWDARVNRHYLGRSWAAPHRAGERMTGVVFFEGGEAFPHAHLVVRPPAGASRLHFELTAPFWFQPAPDPLLRGCYPRPVAPRGTMRVIRIGSDPSDRERVLAYASKGLERWDADAVPWKFLDELQARQLT